MLFRNSGTAEAVARACNWLTYICLPFWLSPEQFGSFSFVLALVLLVSALGTAGQDRVLLRYVGGDNSSDEKQHISTAFSLSPIFSLLMVIVFLSGLYVSGMWSLIEEWVWAVALWIILQSVYMLMIALARARSDNTAFSVLRAGYGISKLIVMCAVAAMSKNVEWLVISEVALLFVVILFGIYTFYGESDFPIEKRVLKKSLKFGMPLIFHILAGAMLGQIDKLMIANMLDKATLGVYAFLNSIAGGVFFVFAVINIVYEAKVYQLGEGAEAESLMRKMFLIAIASAVFLLLLANIALPYLLSFLGKSDYYNFTVVATLSIAYLIYPLYLQSNIRFALKEKTKYIPLISGCAAFSNILLNIVLIPVYGIVGAALSTLGAYIILVTTAQWTSRKV